MMSAVEKAVATPRHTPRQHTPLPLHPTNLVAARYSKTCAQRTARPGCARWSQNAKRQLASTALLSESTRNSMDPHSQAQHARPVDQPPPTQHTNQATRLRQSVLAALLALAVARRRERPTSVSPRARQSSHYVNGAGSFQRRLEWQVKALKIETEQRLKTKIETKGPLMNWPIRHIRHT